MSIAKITNLLKGGPGSGFHGHEGRPGERGGSSAEGGGVADTQRGSSIKRGTPEFKRATKELQHDYLELGYPGQTSYAYQAEQISMDDGYEKAKEILGKIEELDMSNVNHPMFRLKGETKWRSILDTDDFPQPDTEPFGEDEDMDKGISKVTNLLKGGEGSGNFGHEGRPGERGGSAPEGEGGGGGGGKESKQFESKDLENTFSNIKNSDFKSKMGELGATILSERDRRDSFGDDTKSYAVKIGDKIFNFDESSYNYKNSMRNIGISPPNFSVREIGPGSQLTGPGASVLHIDAGGKYRLTDMKGNPIDREIGEKPSPSKISGVERMERLDEIPKKADNWHIYGGGSSAPYGKYAYAITLKNGNYAIDPVASMRGKMLGYKLRFENVKGKVSGRGMHTTIGEGYFKTPSQAVKAAIEDYSKIK